MLGFPVGRTYRQFVDYSTFLCYFFYWRCLMFSDFDRFQRFIIALALIVLALDLFYWRP